MFTYNFVHSCKPFKNKLNYNTATKLALLSKY